MSCWAIPWAKYYALCDVAFIGGSLLPLGGQNLIEALALGKPVLVGEHTFNFLSITDQAIEAGAACRISSTEQLWDMTSALFADPDRIAAMTHAAHGFAGAHQGASHKTTELLAPLLAR